MSEPEFTFDRGIASMTWGTAGAPDYVEFMFDFLRPDRRTGDVRAELVVRNGTSTPLYRTPLSLTGPNAKRDAAKDLGDVAKGELKAVNWRERIETACWRVIDAHRSGRPEINLWDASDPPDAGLLLPPLLVKNDAVIIFGDGGDGKSYLALALALSLQTGHPLVGYLRPLGRPRVAYLDWEWRPEPHKKRMRALLGDEPDENARLLTYIPCAAEGPLVHQVDRLRRIFHERQIEYAVLDSVALGCDGPPEDALVALAFFQALARLEVGACLLAHTNRSGDPEKPFGSTFWHNSARLTWNVQKDDDEEGAQDTDSLRVILHNRKANDGPKSPPVGLEYEFGARTIINCREVLATKQKSERAGNSLRGRLIELLRGTDGATYEDAAMALDSTPDYVRKIVQQDLGRTFKRFPDRENARITRLGLLGADS